MKKVQTAILSARKLCRCWYGVPVTVCILAGIVGTALAEMRVYTTDGKVYTLPVDKQRIKSIEFGGVPTPPPTPTPTPPPAPSPTPPPAPKPQSMRVFNAVASQDSSAFKAHRDYNLQVSTTVYDRIPYHMTTPFEKTIVLGSQQRCILAGNTSGTAGWSVDNFLLLEITTGSGVKRYVIGYTDPVSYKGQSLHRIGPLSSSFAAGAIDLTQYLPKETPTGIRISALDYGGSGHVSDLFLIFR